MIVRSLPKHLSAKSEGGIEHPRLRGRKGRAGKMAVRRPGAAMVGIDAWRGRPKPDAMKAAVVAKSCWHLRLVLPPGYCLDQRLFKDPGGAYTPTLWGSRGPRGRGLGGPTFIFGPKNFGASQKI